MDSAMAKKEIDLLSVTFNRVSWMHSIWAITLICEYRMENTRYRHCLLFTISQ